VPSRSNCCELRISLVACVAAAWLWIVPAQFASAQELESGAPSQEQIEVAIEQLKVDPNLTPERKTRTLKWAGKNEPREKSSFGTWITNFFVWIGQASAALVWVIGGLLAIALVWFLIRLFSGIRPSEIMSSAAVVPTHVRDMDIRPESLPDDVGAAALALWERGEHRSALALLYRGLLSRLAHVHRVPIRDSSTEGDCLDLAARQLSAERKDYVARLIGVWQRAIYGGRDTETQEVQSLCAGFDKALAPPPSVASGQHSA
jgi:hypothetical protein